MQGRRLGRAAVLGTAALMTLGAATASATTVAITSGQLQVTDNTGTANDITIGHPVITTQTVDSTKYAISDTAGISDPIPITCTRSSATSITCPSAGITAGQILLAAGNDRFVGLPGSGVNLTVDGAAGADRLEPSASGTLVVTGGAENDELRAPNNYAGGTFSGDDGDDTLFGGTAPDLLSGGGGNDRISAGGNADRAVGGDGDDTLSGQSGRDKLAGQLGDDKLSGGGGKDKLNGGPGRDKGKGGRDDDKCASIEILLGDEC